MPKHPDFIQIYKKMVAQYGKEKGRQVYYSWLNRNKLDDTKPFPKGKKLKSPTTPSERKKKESITFFQSILTEEKKSNINESNDFIRIKGTAIKARLSRNNVLYEIDELKKAEETLKEKTIAVGHSESPNDIVGIIEDTETIEDELRYFGKVYNTAAYPDIIQKIERGLINKVSIEAIPGKMVKDDKGIIHVANLEFIGLGFVRHEGIPEASVSVEEALAYYNDKDNNEDEDDSIDEIDGDRSDEDLKQGGSMEENLEAVKQEIKEELKTSKELTDLKESVKDQFIKMTETLKEISDKIKTLEETKSKGIVTEDTEPSEKRKLVFEGKKTGKMHAFADQPADWY